MKEEEIIKDFVGELHKIIEKYESNLNNLIGFDSKLTCDVDDVYNWIQKAERNYLKNKTK